jgi:hypothetical protein
MQLIQVFNFLVVLTFSLGCSKYSKELPKDFSFEIISATESYNSQSGYFTRKAVTDNFTDTTVLYNLSQQDREDIYKVFIENDLLSIPKSFECASDAQFMIPAFTTTLKFQINGITQEIKFNTSCFPKKEESEAVKFDNIVQYIRKKLLSKRIIQQLPETEMRFIYTPTKKGLKHKFRTFFFC